MNTSLQTYLTRLGEIEGRATAAPWEVSKWGDGSNAEGFANVAAPSFEYHIAIDTLESDATFIALARNEIARLVEMVRIQQEALEIIATEYRPTVADTALKRSVASCVDTARNTLTRIASLASAGLGEK